MIRERDVAASDSDAIHVTLPDGSARTYPRGVTGAEVAASIGKGLAKAAFAVEVDGEIRDLSRPIDGDARVRILKTDDPDALPVLRHDAAHVMAEAVQDLYPGTQVTIGPAIENGFYYDFHREEPFTPDDLARIEGRRAEVRKAAQPFGRPGGDRARDGRDGKGRKAVRSPGGEPRGREGALRRHGRTLQARAPGRDPR